MGTISIEATDKTPSIKFNANQGKLELKGRSIPPNAVEFYKPLTEALKNYRPEAGLPVVADIYLEFFNTVSSKCILDALRLLDALHQKGNNVKINWYYEKDDKDIQEAGIDFQAILKLPFTLISVNEEN